jgi:hypothetical protein
MAVYDAMAWVPPDDTAIGPLVEYARVRDVRAVASAFADLLVGIVLMAFAANLAL